ncbi:MAG TPA: NADPH-dependent FMN reductase [Roseiflexaceae bacterium]|nr:NADPH-dependent FMN reductase [Roseiflexaceae bacterium]
MVDIVTVGGSPSETSRTAAALEYARCLLEQQGLHTADISVRQLPAEDLLLARFDSPAVRQSRDLIAQANGLVIATPIYKAAYSGLLKAFLDLLPQQAFEGKVILPLATGGTIAHLLAIDYALRPVLAALGGQHILGGIYLLDQQIQREGGQVTIDAAGRERLGGALQTLVQALPLAPQAGFAIGRSAA